MFNLCRSTCAATLIALAVALAASARAEPVADFATLFSDLCVESGLTTAGLEHAFARITHGETPLERLETDREQIYSREIRIGGVDFAVQAVAPASTATFRNCRVSAEFPGASLVETLLDRNYPHARRTQPMVQRVPAGSLELLQVTAKWIGPRPGMAAIELTVEVLAKRQKATLTAIPALP